MKQAKSDAESFRKLDAVQNGKVKGGDTIVVIGSDGSKTIIII